MSVNQIIDSMQEVFVRQCRALAHSSGFCRRASRLHAGAWVRGLVFGWLSNPKASVSALAASIAMAGAVVSPQAVQKRFNEAGARLLRGVLEGLTPSALYQAATLDLNPKESAWLKAFPATLVARQHLDHFTRLAAQTMARLRRVHGKECGAQDFGSMGMA